uniref:Uncharacterized protein n=1 Tax=Capra hircus TaxID=9925 RepID=A0A8C2REB4_CAPHI
MGLLKKCRGETIPEQLQTREEKVNPRPLSMLVQPVKNNTQVPISCHNRKTQRRGGLRFPRVARARSPSQSTRTTASQRCSCAESSWSCETRSSLTRRGLLPTIRTCLSFLFVKQKPKY